MELLLIIGLVIVGFSILKLSISTVFKLMLYIVIASIILNILGWWWV
jgi:hypothetical protein